MSEIKPVYQSQTDGVWHDVRKTDFDARSHCPDLFNQRILYPAAAYEALQKENENLAYRLNNAQDSAIKALEDNAAQEKRIADLEAATEYQDTCTDGGKCGAGGYCKDCIQEPTKDE